MKVLFLVEDIECAAPLHTLGDVKIITETEITKDTPYENGRIKVGYSQYVVSRASSLAKIYNFKPPLAVVLHQDHQTAISNIVHDKSVRIVHNIIPRRLTQSVTYKCDYTFLLDEVSQEALRDIFEQVVS
jgi:hypothetical protein